MAIPPARSVGDSGHIQDHNDMNEELAARLPLSGGTLTGAISGTSATFSGNVVAADPTSDTHLATKSYVDSNSASVTGLSTVYMTTVTVTFTLATPWLGAVFPTGSTAYNDGLNDAWHIHSFVVTLPSGVFSAAPYVMAKPGQAANVTNATATNATSVYVQYANLYGRVGTNTGFVFGPSPYTFQTDTIRIIAMEA